MYEFSPWVRKIPWRRAWQPILVFLPEESHGQRSLVGYVPWVAKSRICMKQLTLSQAGLGDELNGEMCERRAKSIKARLCSR